MIEFMDLITPFVYGFMVGWLWYPIWQILKKIWSEAKKAQRDW